MTQAKLMSQAELAGLFEVRRETVRDWERAGCPVERKSTKAGEPSLYRPAHVIAWDRERAVRAATGDLAAADMDALRQRKLAAETMLAELTLAQRQGDLVEVDAVVRETETMLSLLRARLVSLGAIAAPQLELARTAAERQSVIDAAVYQALTEISGSPWSFLGPADDGDDSD